ncbi:MAG: MoaD/ThiS family protein [Pirellulales bacterium]
MNAPSIVVEFYGIPRQRAGVERTAVVATSLGSAIESLAERFPQLAVACFQGNQLHAAYTANLNGQRFVRDPDTPLADGDILLFLSADAGG